MHESRPRAPLVIKCDERVDYSIPSIIKDELTALAVIAGKSFAVFMRDQAIVLARGYVGLAKLKGMISHDRSDDTSLGNDVEG